MRFANAGVSSVRRTATAVLKHGVVASILGHLRCVCFALIMALVVMLVGATALCMIERGAEAESFQRRMGMQAKLQAELSPETYQELLRSGWWDHMDDGFKGKLQWSIAEWSSARSSLLFAFTLSSTVGYGNAELRTDAGRAFAMLFSMFAIPFTIAVYMFVAAHVTSLVQVVVLSLTHPSWETFRKYDTDGNGTLEAGELRAALEDMGVAHVTQDIALQIIEHLQPDGCHLCYFQFCRAVRILLPPRIESQHRHAKLLASLLLLLAWLALGGVVFSRCEGWRFQEAIWYCWVTLTTIGLGDFVPATPAGHVATVLWSMFGLGLVAMLVSAVSERLAHMASLEECEESYEPTDTEKCELRVRRMLSQESNLLSLPRLKRTLSGLSAMSGLSRTARHLRKSTSNLDVTVRRMHSPRTQLIHSYASSSDLDRGSKQLQLSESSSFRSATAATALGTPRTVDGLGVAVHTPRTVDDDRVPKWGPSEASNGSAHGGATFERFGASPVPTPCSNGVGTPAAALVKVEIPRFAAPLASLSPFCPAH